MTRKVTLACTQFACSWDKEGNLVRRLVQQLLAAAPVSQHWAAQPPTAFD